MLKLFPVRLLLVAMVSAYVIPVSCQELGHAADAAKSGNESMKAEGQEKKTASRFFVDFAKDQTQLWASPARLRFSDTAWLVPLSGLTAGLFVTDSDVSRHLSHKPTTVSHYGTLSNAGVAALVGGAGAMWVFSHATHNEHWRETGFLAGEAALHSLVMTETLKYSLRRSRPYQGDGTGPFFQGGGTSFPSEHSAAAWSVAGVIAHEYPGPLSKILAYGGATLVSYARVRAGKHFPSDVAVGAALGELAAYQVYKRHHDPELGGDAWESWREKARSLGVGSPYVPLDSWIYVAFDRLAGMGSINTGFVGMRPWTRRECARLVSEAADQIEQSSSEAGTIYRELETEFRPELEPASGAAQVRVESVYTRMTNVSGTPLQDGYHFGQTSINDFGRPYGEGWNSVTGFSFYTTTGPWVGYVRGEMQTAPAIPSFPLAARQFIATVDALPGLPPATPTPAVQQFRLLDAYVGLTISNLELSFGPQSLSWGPGDGGALMFSDNAAPIPMFRINRVTPLRVPFLSRIFGPVRAEFFFGQLSGHHFFGIPGGVTGDFGSTQQQPFIHGQRFTFKPTSNFEFGFSRTTIMGGPGVPLTLGTFRHSLFGIGDTPNVKPGTPADPGDRRSGLDWTYRIPKLRDWLTFYGDAFTDDQFSPIAYWDRSAIRGGLYLSHVPKLAKLDFRVEGVYTDVPVSGLIGQGFFYFNTRFREGYTNDGHLMGSWIGRDGQGAQGWASYWFKPKDRVQVSFRHQKVSHQFPPHGGTLTDVRVTGDYWIRGSWEVSASVQYERWLFPVVQAGPETNVKSSVEIKFQPQRLFSPLSHHKSDWSAGTGNSD